MSNLFRIFSINFMLLTTMHCGFSQKAYFFPDAIVNFNDSVVIRLNGSQGLIQWQRSLDSQHWDNIPTAHHDSLLFMADTTTYFRAEVVAGDCEPFYSDTTKVGVARVITLSATEVTHHSAMSGGNIIADGGAEIITRGVVWSIVPNPGLDDHEGLTTDGSGSGEFASQITGLLPETDYYVRAYFTHNSGTVYGGQVSFTTSASEPDVYTLTLQVFPENAGQVSPAGDYIAGETITITAIPNDNFQFVSWSGDTEHIADTGSASTTLVMPSQDVVLTANFEAEGGNDGPGNGVTDIDGNFYTSVIIGNQEWMAEDLRVTRDADGNDIIRYCYNNNENYCELYGGLYTWHTVMNGANRSNTDSSNIQGICPTGWHVPSRNEWIELVNYLEDQGFPNTTSPDGAGNALKSCRQVSSPLGDDCATTEHPRWNAHDTNFGTDEFGFSAFSGGHRTSTGNYSSLGSRGSYWSSTDTSTNNAIYRLFYHSLGLIDSYSVDKNNGYALRCIRTTE